MPNHSYQESVQCTCNAMQSTMIKLNRANSKFDTFTAEPAFALYHATSRQIQRIDKLYIFIYIYVEFIWPHVLTTTS